MSHKKINENDSRIGKFRAMNKAQITLKIKNTFYYLFPRTKSLIIGKIKNNGIKVYWYKNKINFGDFITPLILKRYGFTPIFSNPSKAQLISTGSILEHLPPDYSGIILGSGFINDELNQNFEKAQILSVRGNMTKKRLKSDTQIKLGDPGILAARLVDNRKEKIFKLGIIPHFVDKDQGFLKNIKSKYPQKTTIIDVQQDPLRVFAEIDQCEYIISSSLHGLIVADSFHIPNAWLGSKKVIGGRYKFDDYYSSLDTTKDPINITGDETLEELLAYTDTKPIENIEKLKTDVDSLFLNLKQQLSLD